MKTFLSPIAQSKIQLYYHGQEIKPMSKVTGTIKIDGIEFNICGTVVETNQTQMKTTKLFNELPLPEGWPKPPEGYLYVGNPTKPNFAPDDWLCIRTDYDDKWGALIQGKWHTDLNPVAFAAPAAIVRRLSTQARDKRRKKSSAPVADCPPVAPVAKRKAFLYGGTRRYHAEGTTEEIYAKAEEMAITDRATIEVYFISMRFIPSTTVKREVVK